MNPNPNLNLTITENPGPTPNLDSEANPIFCPSLSKKLCLPQSQPLFQYNTSCESILDVFNDHILLSILHKIDDYFDRQSWRLCCKHFRLLEASCRTHVSLLRVHILPLMWPLCPRLQHINLTHCTFLSDENLHSVVALTARSRLQSLKLVKLHTFTDSGLLSLAKECSSLVEVDLSQCYQLSDLGIMAFAHIKTLKVLKLIGCRVVTDVGVVALSIGCEKLEVLKLKLCRGITDVSIVAMASHSRELRELDLSYTKITNIGISALAKLNLLEKLSLMGCNYVDDDGLANLRNGCKSLQMLDISRCNGVSHAGIMGLASGVFSLQHIVLSYCVLVTDEVLQKLKRFSNLQSIRLDGCDLNGFELGLIGKFFKNLKELSLSKCKGVTDVGLSATVAGCTRLSSIDLTCCHGVTDVGLSFIANFCKDLITLKMEACSQVTEQGFSKLSSCQYLEELDLTDTNLDDEGLMAAAKCKSLRILKMGICLNVLDEGLCHIASNCLNLRELDMYRSSGIGNRGIAAICIGCKELRSLNISYCTNVTNSGLIEITQLRNLNILEMRGCTNVTSLGLVAIAKGCSRLVKLDIKHCSTLEDSVPLALAQCCNNLKQINISYCVATDEGVIALARLQSMQNMRLIHVKNLSMRGVCEVLAVGESLNKVKLLVEFKEILPWHIMEHAEKRGCRLRWMDKGSNPR